ncbi:hypothetical protein ISF_04344 [Cordyceps fumosorosea ARSEF 2679]|uniref:Uncharacterized protein n=1 Tax=Cordyceps fumosorosea (strain ARSEF 2679) TaxID=1081104 RepID=A0A167XFZ1_CORFA|nr:hypothetical protein ISF_04344 [Cordyceps fumosorosea ARSEF 2679]OAA64934.1 hypothetical protein ISF_04344 [Cordyceps fumosorosea ARSEF 2679]
MKLTTTTVLLSLVAGALAGPLLPVPVAEKPDGAVARGEAAVPNVYPLKARMPENEKPAVRAVDEKEDSHDTEEEGPHQDEEALDKRNPFYRVRPGWWGPKNKKNKPKSRNSQAGQELAKAE